MTKRNQLPGFTADIQFAHISNYQIGEIEEIDSTVIPQKSFHSPISRNTNSLLSGISIISNKMNYNCNGFFCSCSGDDDCNDMFESGNCGNIAQCDERGCWCLSF